MHVVHVLERVRVIRVEVRAVRIARRLVQVVVLGHELLELRLHIGELGRREVKLGSGTLACLRYFRKVSSSGCSTSSARPLPPARAVRPTRWMYSLGSSGGSYCTIQSTCGMSRPRAATSVQSSMPALAAQKSKKVVVRLFCLRSPCLLVGDGGSSA